MFKQFFGGVGTWLQKRAKNALIKFSEGFFSHDKLLSLAPKKNSSQSMSGFHVSV